MTSSIQVSEEMPPCRFCGARCRVENFNSEHVEATLWICGNNEYFGGDCPDQTAYLYEHSWQDAMKAAEPPMTSSIQATELRAQAREIVNRHCEYTDGLSRGQVMMKTSHAVDAVAEALAMKAAEPLAQGDECDRIFAVLRDWRLSTMAQEDEPTEGYPLVDAVSTPEGTIASGEEELGEIAAAISAALVRSPQGNECERLDALTPFLKHNPECAYYRTSVRPDGSCICGLSKLMDDLRAALVRSKPIDRERVARALSIPQHHTTWDILSEAKKDLFYMQADYAITAIGSQSIKGERAGG